MPSPSASADQPVATSPRRPAARSPPPSAPASPPPPRSRSPARCSSCCASRTAARTLPRDAGTHAVRPLSRNPSLRDPSHPQREEPPMIEFTIETRIDRPIAQVFAYVTDPGQLPTWQTNTVSAAREDDGPIAIGSRLREVHRAPGGKQLESVVEVSDYELNRTFGLRVVEGTPVHAR